MKESEKNALIRQAHARVRKEMRTICNEIKRNTLALNTAEGETAQELLSNIAFGILTLRQLYKKL